MVGLANCGLCDAQATGVGGSSVVYYFETLYIPKHKRRTKSQDVAIMRWGKGASKLRSALISNALLPGPHRMNNIMVAVVRAAW